MKAIRIIFAALFVIICSIPVFTMPFFADNSNAEKRQDTEAPSITLEDGSFNWEYPTLLDAYLSDHFAFRTPAVTLASILKAELGTSNQDKVVVGDEDWLFFGETLDDFCGKNQLSDYDILRLAKTISLMNEYVVAKGGKFVFAAAPNKNSIYGEYMPYYYAEKKGKSNLDKLTDILGGEDYYLDLKSALEGSKNLGTLYHKRDSHWNNLGASVAFAEISKKLGIEGTSYSSLGFEIKNNWRGDLDNMIFPALNIMDDNVIFDKEYTFKYGPKYKAPEDLMISTTGKGKNGSLKVFRDSFYNALLPFFAEEFQSAEFTRVLPYRITATVESGDYVIVEIAERNLKNLLAEAPVMTAVEKNFDSLEKIDVIHIENEKSGKFSHIYGVLDDNIDATRLAIGITADGNTRYFEPFPIYEEKLEGESGNGFSLYLDELPQGAEISVYKHK